MDRRRRRSRLLVLTLAMLLAAAMLTPATGTPPATARDTAEPSVLPAPTHRESRPGAFALHDGSRIRYAPDLADTAQTLADDLAALGHRLPVRPGVDRAQPGDIVLETGDVGLDDEGYHLKVGRVAEITAGSDTGAYYGTRTLLQLLKRSGRTSAVSIRDQPRYPDRGVAICPCALKVSVDSIERIITEMGYLKLNYLLLPLKMRSDRHPKINQWAYYTPEEARRIVEIARKHHVRVVPEINAPGHMEPFLFDRPDLQLTDSDGNSSPARIDITRPEAFDFYTDLIDEYAEIFADGVDQPEWHLGADEYMINSAYQKYPQIAEYAQDKFGPDAEPEDAFIDFVNRVDDYVRQQHGMQLRIWNDGIPERNITAGPGDPHPRLNPGITVEHWAPADTTPAALLQAGHPVTNAASSLYEDAGGRVSGHALCPDASRLEDCLPELWAENWTPTLFEDGNRVDAAADVTGAHLSLWQSDPVAETEVELEQRISDAMRLVAERTWSPVDNTESYQQFEDRIADVGQAPRWRDPTDAGPLPGGEYRITAESQRSGPTAFAPGGPAGTADAGRTWELSGTADGYYRITDPGTGQCVGAVRAGVIDLLESAPAVGSEPKLEPCDAGRATQRWELTGDARTGFELINAIHQLPATLTDDGSTRLLPPDRTEPTRWGLQRRSGVVAELRAPDLLKPGEPNRVTLAVTNHERGPIRVLDADLDVPATWEAEPANRRARPLPPGGRAEFDYRVTPDADAATDRKHRLSAELTYRHRHQRVEVDRGIAVGIHPIPCPTPDAPRPGPDDDFDAAELDGCRWSEIGAPDVDALQVSDDHLRIRTGPGELAGATNDAANLILQPVAADDWSIEVKMTAPLAERYQQAGLLLYADDDNFAEFVLVSDAAPGTEPSYYLALASEVDGEFGAGGQQLDFEPPESKDQTWWLRLTKSGQQLSAASSADGANWKSMPGTVTAPEGDDLGFGLVAAGPGQTSPTTVAFDHFRVRPR